MQVSIKCPGCEKWASIGSASTNGAANDDEDIVTYAAPDGFRKVQFGWNSSDVRFVCTSCGDAAILIPKP